MRTIRIGAAGLGRIGYRHAENIAFKTPGAELAAVCSILPSELERARQSFPGVATYDDYAAMLRDRSLDAVFLSTPTGLHREQIEAGLAAGFHVFSEKPLGVNVAECEYLEKVVARHPRQVFMLGLNRRYDESYAHAKRLIDAGQIGTPFLVRSYGLDPMTLIESALRFAPTSGGIFLDMAVHDIDLANWYLGDQPASVYAIGGSFVRSEFADFGDCDNACAMLQYQHGGMAMLYVGRTAAHGYHAETEIIGSRGALRIGAVPQKDLVQVFGEGGVLQECVAGYRERFASAYLGELQEFVRCIQEGRQPDVRAEDGTLATRIAFAATEAYRERKVVRF
jgi:myo-inositol 2-dehydrogenase/D-chiro-inositol 1-dehydrogenase